MDVTFDTDAAKINYRAAGIVIEDGKILAMKDEKSPYYYLPGGRVLMGETAENAVLREFREELCADARIERPLWLAQSFFTEDVDGKRYHELCVYFLMDIGGTDILSRGERFTLYEGVHTHVFEWLPVESLENEYFYPLFLKTEASRLPETFTIRTDIE